MGIPAALAHLDFQGTPNVKATASTGILLEKQNLRPTLDH